MNALKIAISAVFCVACIAVGTSVMAQSKSDNCKTWAREQQRAQPTTTGAARGAARGAVVGAIAGDAGRGAGIGAATGATRRAVQKSRSYQSYYNECMAR